MHQNPDEAPSIEHRNSPSDGELVEDTVDYSRIVKLQNRSLGAILVGYVCLVGSLSIADRAIENVWRQSGHGAC